MNGDDTHIPSLVPVFPLPGVVLFPRAILPLHIFEPRYREMAADAMTSDRVIAIALLKPGFEELYYTRRAPIHPIVGVGRVLASEQLADGNYNILLQGFARARMVEEFKDHSYRVARVEPIVTQPGAPAEKLAELRRDLRQVVRQGEAVESEIRRRLLRLFDAELTLGELTDLVASGIPVMAELRQCLLAEPSDSQRAAMLVEQVRTLTLVTRHKRRAQSGGHESLN